MPARKLSQSFSLDIVGGKAITVKQVRPCSAYCNHSYFIFTYLGMFADWEHMTLAKVLHSVFFCAIFVSSFQV